MTQSPARSGHPAPGSAPTPGVAGPVRTRPMPAMPPRYQDLEKDYLLEALQRNNLIYLQPDGMVNRMTKRASEVFGSQHCVACSSGSAAVHVAVAACGIEAGAEVITSPICDYGTVIGVLYQNAIPVFADVDPINGNLTAATIAAAITPRTQAVILVHLAGVPCDMDPILELCKQRKIKVIEDCAQAHGAYYKGKHVGTLGDIGIFSISDFKVLSCGEGGLCLTNDAELYRRCHLFADKYYDRLGGSQRMHGLAPCYRMSELQGAVALAQLEKLDAYTKPRHELGHWLSAAIGKIPGILPPQPPAGSYEAFWFYMFSIDEKIVGISRDEFARRLAAQGIPCSGGYLPRPIHHEKAFVDKSFFPGGVWPAELVAGRKYDFAAMAVPNAQLLLSRAIRTSLHQGYQQQDVEDIAEGIRRVAAGARG